MENTLPNIIVNGAIYSSALSLEDNIKYLYDQNY